MTRTYLEAARSKMMADGIGASAIEAFSYAYRQLEAGQTGLIAEDEIEPLDDIERFDEETIDPELAREAFSRTAIIKLNGGLGTSMGMSGPKSLLTVRDSLTFLDMIVAQVRAARQRYQVKLPLIMMNSFNTRDATLEALRVYEDLAVDGLPCDFMQSREPKLRADDLSCVEWPSDPSLEWCPPGHGDIYASLVDSGVLDQLIDAGYRYASVSNSDNLGASPNAALAGWFASTNAAFGSELCRRTVNDLKGGHLARRRSDGHLILRETAQTSSDDMRFFTDEKRHPFFHTNNLWFNLIEIKKVMEAKGGVLGLPLIRNEKTVDPRDPSSTKVIQIESAMGAAIEVFDRAEAIEVGRDRFIPVKKTNELLLLRSDCYEVDEESYRLHRRCSTVPAVDLDPATYGMIDDFNWRFPYPLSLKEAHSFTVRGDITFGRDVTVRSDVRLESQEPMVIADGTVCE